MKIKTPRNSKEIRLPGPIRSMFPLVEECVDATEPVDVDVTERDCSKEAKRLNPNECAMARAVKRQFKADGVIIGLSKSYIVRGKRAIRFTTPQTVSREITSFDRHHDFAPGSYRLSAVSPSSMFGARPDRPRGRRGNKASGRPTRAYHKSVRVRTLPTG